MNKSLLALLAAGVLSTSIAIAQQNPAGGGAGAGGRGNFGGRGGAGGGMMVLDDQQRQLYREATQKDAEKLRALDEKLRAAQKELVDATLASTYDEKLVREKAEAIAKIQVEITMLRAKALATVAPTMKPEQKQQIVESRMAIIMLTGGFDPTAAGGRGGGGFGGRGGGQGGGGRGGRGGGGQ